MPWLFLTIAGLLEVVWATSMKQSQGFTRLAPSIVTIVAMIVSFILLAVAMKSLPLGISYTVWVGIGAVGSVILGVAYFHERLNPWQVLCVVLIGAGIIGLKLSTPAKPAVPSVSGAATPPPAPPPGASP
jgi:quaternary ammonium compound-resistance protein SugE